MNTSKADLNKKGETLEKKIKEMYAKALEPNIPDKLRFEYMDKFLEITHEKVNLVMQLKNESEKND